VRLSAEQCALLRSAEHELQVLCVRTDDPVPHRFHFPCHASLSLNGAPLAVPCRTLAFDLGKNGRDPPAGVGAARLSTDASPQLAQLFYALRGAGPAGMSLRLLLAGYDSRPFAVSVRIARKRSLAELRGLLPPAQGFAACLSRALRIVAGDGGADEEAEVQATAVPLSLRDALSGRRMATPVRYKGCAGLAAFDLDSFLQAAGRSRSWSCPLCRASGPPSELLHDSYVAAVLRFLDNTGGADDAAVSEVQVHPCGGWRPVLRGGGLGRLVSARETEEGAASGAKPAPCAVEAAGAARGPETPPTAEETAAAEKRKREEAEVICLVSDSEDDAPAAKRPAPAPPPPPPPPPMPPVAPMPMLPPAAPFAQVLPAVRPAPPAMPSSGLPPMRFALRMKGSSELMPRQPPSEFALAAAEALAEAVSAQRRASSAAQTQAAAVAAMHDGWMRRAAAGAAAAGCAGCGGCAACSGADAWFSTREDAALRTAKQPIIPHGPGGHGGAYGSAPRGPSLERAEPAGHGAEPRREMPTEEDWGASMTEGDWANLFAE
jgi:hypothetical protein